MFHRLETQVKHWRMYWPIPDIKEHPEKRWNQPDRAFFGFGACHILTGVFLEDAPWTGFYGEWIIPFDGFSGAHIYATDGQITFDFHGYTTRQKLLDRYWKRYQDRIPNWNADVVIVDFPLLSTFELNARNHRGPGQYFKDPIPRARRFIASKTCPANLRPLP